MATICQLRTPTVIAIAGVAGSGKSTLGRRLAHRLNAPVLDLDSLTNPLLDQLEAVLGGHWLRGPHAAGIRAGRYASMRATAADIVASTGVVILVAPFTAELGGGTEWRQLRHAVAPAEVRVARIVGAPEVFAARRELRGELRDRHRPIETAEPVVQVPHVAIDAAQSTDLQLAQLLRELQIESGQAPGDQRLV